MLKIGEVAKLLNIPIKTIRYWEEEGLIKPAYVDEWTGYRQYDECNIDRLSQIVYLKALGLSLKEIAKFDSSSVPGKIQELEKQSYAIKQKIRKLSSMRNKKGEIVMKNFVNDENAIGHWKLLGFAETLEKAKESKFIKNPDFKINEMYLMEGGQEYWVIGWTKGAIFICDHKNPYEIIGNKMIVTLTYDGEIEGYAVYEKVDSKKHTVKDFMRVDDINMPFVKDEKSVGAWKTFDFIRSPKKFDPEKREFDPESLKFLLQVSLLENGDAYIDFKNGTDKHRWTKDYILFNWGERTLAMKYCVVTKANVDYLIMEWKSGDYEYAGQINGYYVFKRD